MATEIEKDKIGDVSRAEFEVLQLPEAFKDWKKRSKDEDALLKRLQVDHNKCVETGKVGVGFLYTEGVADGKAMYRVESVKPLRLQHVPFGDGYRISNATMRGLRLSDLQRKLDFDLWWKKTTKTVKKEVANAQ